MPKPNPYVLRATAGGTKKTMQGKMNIYSSHSGKISTLQEQQECANVQYTK